MKKLVLLIAVLALVASVAFPAEAEAQSYPYYPPEGPYPMYCSKVVIKPGASTQQVLTFCGVPDSRSELYAGYEEWTYINNLSHWDFHLTFENGRLESIQRY